MRAGYFFRVENLSPAMGARNRFQEPSLELNSQATKAGGPVRQAYTYLVPTPHSGTKVPKRENFSLSFFALSEPIWVSELGTGEKNRIFYRLTPVFDGFRFFATY
jgi:hypothetical protein